MKRFVVVVGVLVVGLLAWTPTSVAAPLLWQGSTPFTKHQVASQPTTGGGYPVPPGSRVPLAGRAGQDNTTQPLKSWPHVKPGTEDLLGTSKIFFEKYSTFYMFHLGAMTMPRATPSTTTQVQGYDCVSTGTQAMPPSWTDNTDPNVAFTPRAVPIRSRCSSTPSGQDEAVSERCHRPLVHGRPGMTWVKGIGGNDLEQSPMPRRSSWVTSRTSSRRSPHRRSARTALTATTCARDVVGVRRGHHPEIRIAVSGDRGQTLARPGRSPLPAADRPVQHVRLPVGGHAASCTSRSRRSP